MSVDNSTTRPGVNIESRWENAKNCLWVIPDTKERGVYYVMSDSKRLYRVVLKGKTTRKCQCTYGSMRRQPCCKHVLAAARYAAVEKGYRAMWPVPSDHDWKYEGADKVFNVGEGFMLMVRKG